MLSVQTQHLSFFYKKNNPVLSNISLEVPEGAAFGLLGQNGAGKTTLLKLLPGLLKPVSGEIRLLGRSPKEVSIFHQVGNVIEGPHLYHHLSGRQNLEVFAQYRQLGNGAIERVLDQVGLTEQAEKKVGQYSSGMKQRLAIGLALLPDPRLLLLDEPTNGLDPEGISDIRRLIQRLSKEEHRTIIFSSHILSEVEQVCTHIGILKNEELLFQGTYEVLRRQVAVKEVIYFKVEEPEKALAILKNKNLIAAIEENRLRIQLDHPRDISSVIDRLRQHDLLIYRIESEENQLEKLFLSLEKDKHPTTNHQSPTTKT